MAAMDFFNQKPAVHTWTQSPTTRLSRLGHDVPWVKA
jgi:hypothetical protein